MIWDSEECRDVEELMKERLGKLIPSSSQVTFFGETLEQESRASMVFTGLSQGAKLTLEALIHRQAEKVSEVESRYLLMDALDTLAFDWFESEAHTHGRWQNWTFQSHELLVRLDRSFPELEAMADQMLEGGKASSH